MGKPEASALPLSNALTNVPFSLKRKRGGGLPFPLSVLVHSNMIKKQPFQISWAETKQTVELAPAVTGSL